jgi:hypothetical protein
MCNGSKGLLCFFLCVGRSSASGIFFNLLSCIEFLAVPLRVSTETGLR